MRPELYQKEFWAEYVEMGKYKLEVYDNFLLEFDLSRTSESYQVLMNELHSLKGVSATIGVDVMVRTCHEAESVLEHFWEGSQAQGEDIPEELTYVKRVLSKVIAEEQASLLDEPQMRAFLLKIGAWKDPAAKNEATPIPASESKIDLSSTQNSKADHTSNDKANPSSSSIPTTSTSKLRENNYSEPMIQLMYLSKKSNNLTLGDVMYFSRKAKAYNKEHSITGMLIYFQGSFFQMLEGPISEVNKLYNKISKDDRHKDVYLLNVQTIYSRRFQKWSLNNISSASYQALRELMVAFGMIDEKVAFPMNYEIMNIMVDKLRKNPEGVYH